MDHFPDWASCQTYALAALSESDRTVMRCYESGIPVPAEWRDYRKALRSIVSATTGDPTQPLPPRPPYPSGT
ncbi:hypothetical protein [Paraburkholderia sp. MM6662-R1]|uniref:hypothetical protein n=1 Tax=Paraburkholderia sp. MM6662-R1 TaxID=2991066 RepID=UPI003D1D93F9